MRRGKLRSLALLLVLLMFAAGLAIFLYPYLWGAMVDREISLNAQDFLNRDEIAPITPEVVVTVDSPTEPEETKAYPELWADMVRYNETIYTQGQTGLSCEYDYQKPSFRLSDYGLGDEVFGVISIPAMELEMPIFLGAKEPSDWEYNSIKSAHPEDIVLYQVGDFFEIYGEDAKQAAPVLDLNLDTRPVPTGGRVDMCGIAAHQLEEATQKLRDRFHVTIAAVGEDGQRNSYSMGKLNPEPPRREITQSDIDEALQKWNGSIGISAAVPLRQYPCDQAAGL